MAVNRNLNRQQIQNVATTMVKETNNPTNPDTDRGATVIVTGNSGGRATNGYAVGTEGHEQVVDHPLSWPDAVGYVNGKAQVLADDPNNVVGVWGPQNNPSKDYLDVSTVIPDTEPGAEIKALNTAYRNRQIGMGHLGPDPDADDYYDYIHVGDRVDDAQGNVVSYKPAMVDEDGNETRGAALARGMFAGGFG